MNKRVLLTGASGLIGRSIQAKSSKTIDLFLTSKSSFDAFDLTSIELIHSKLDQWRPDVIIHTAAIASVDYAEHHKTECEQLNVKATEKIAEWCAKNSARLIFFSTDFVFDGTRSDLKESDQPNPLSFYGKSKLKAEKIIQKLLSDFVIIRPILVYGYEANLSRLNFPLLVASKLSAGQAMKITADQMRMPTYVEDVAVATLNLVDSDFAGIVHLSGPELMSVYDFAIRVSEVLSLDASLLNPVETRQMNQGGLRPLVSGFDYSLAKETVGFVPRSVEEGLQSMIKKLPGRAL